MGPKFLFPEMTGLCEMACVAPPAPSSSRHLPFPEPGGSLFLRRSLKVAEEWGGNWSLKVVCDLKKLDGAFVQFPTSDGLLYLTPPVLSIGFLLWVIRRRVKFRRRKSTCRTDPQASAGVVIRAKARYFQQECVPPVPWVVGWSHVISDGQ